MKAIPHNNPPQEQNTDDQAKTIQAMFSSIATRYDFLNRILSLGIDIQWRKRCIRTLQKRMKRKGRVLDLAAGTGDLALALEKFSGNTIAVTAVDFSHEMLKILKGKKHTGSRISIITGDGLALPFKTRTFDGAMIGFGIRNFTKRPEALKELFRILKAGGILAILEFSIPRKQPLRAAYLFYFEKILPFVGGFFSRRSAYTYLPESVRGFPDPEIFASLINNAGFTGITIASLTGGIATLYCAEKPLIDPVGKIPAV
jgi:demethylmenaquinone methyltransferase/2-methoxy-6-polyprenyl-1,4-benzoquinol methylase